MHRSITANIVIVNKHRGIISAAYQGGRNRKTVSNLPLLRHSPLLYRQQPAPLFFFFLAKPGTISA